MRTAIILIAIAAGLAATAAHADCLLTDNRGPNHDGAEFCIKSHKGMSQAQIDAWYLEEAKRTSPSKKPTGFLMSLQSSTAECYN